MSRLESLWRRIIPDLFHPARVEAAASAAVSITLIVVGTRIAVQLISVVLRRWLRPDDPALPPDRQAQVRTLVPLFESVARYFLYFGALVMILDRLRFNVAGLLAGAGVVGVALGFGAQSIVRDVIAGLFLLSEGLIQVGDTVRIGEVTGEVERISLRATLVRRYSGELVAIPNGQILQIGNMNRGFMRAIVEVGVAYESDLDRAMGIMHATGLAWADEHPEEVLAPPEVQGVLAFGASEVLVRLVIAVKPRGHVAAERELRRRLKAAFDAEGISMISPRRVVHMPGGTGVRPDAAAGAGPASPAGGG